VQMVPFILSKLCSQHSGDVPDAKIVSVGICKVQHVG